MDLAKLLAAPRYSKSCLLLALFLVGFPGTAFGLVSGDAPQLYQQFLVYGDASVTGNTLMSDTCDARMNSVLLPESGGDISGIPSDANIVGAYFFWSASHPSIDNTATLLAPNGASLTVSADGPCHFINTYGGAYSCLADVTSFVDANPSGGDYNGTYRVQGVDGTPGFVDGACQCLDPNGFCQAKFAGWSIVLVYESPTERTQRDVILYEGFRSIDEDLNTAGTDSFNISGFSVGNPPDAKLSFFALEGDRQLGIPPQNFSPEVLGGCPDGTCVDSLDFNGTPLTNANNPPGNLFNGSVPGGFAIGVDLDTYDISNLLDVGDTSASITLRSGDGVANNTPAIHGHGEYLIVDWLLLRINRLSPNFQTDKTFKDVVPNESGPGGTVFFTINVTNDGSLDATDVIVIDALDSNFEYISGTTEIDNVPVSDGVGGQNPLEAGLLLGNLPNDGDNDRRITFQARVRNTATPGMMIPNSAFINATQITEPLETNTVTVTVNGATLNNPTKIAKDLNGGEFNPGDIVEYEIFISNNDDSTVGGLNFNDHISPHAQLTELPTGAFDASGSSLNGGINGTGLIDVTGITIPPLQSGVFLRYKVRILDVDELVAKGVDPSAINGLLISNQGALDAPFLPSPLSSDDPVVPGTSDPTIFSLSTGVDFLGSTTRKDVLDVNGGLLVPGDEIRYTISLNNRGGQPGTVTLIDDVPAFLGGATLLTPMTGLSLNPTGGANGTGQLVLNNVSVAPSSTLNIEFSAIVDPTTPSGTVIINQAQLSVVEDPSQSRPLVSPALEVFNEPVFSDAVKTVVNTSGSGDFQPGDVIRYTISFSNTGSQPGANLSITDIIDPALEAITPEDGGVIAGNSITWSLPDVAPGESGTVHFSATIKAGTLNGALIPNQAIVRADGASDYPTDDPATPATDDPTTILIQARPALDDLAKTFTDNNGGLPEPGDTITYTLTFSNTGRATATSTILTDVINLAFSTVVPLDGGTYDAASRAVTWNLGDVPTGESRQVSFEATLADVLVPGSVSNQAQLTALELPDPVLSDDPSTPLLDDPTLFNVTSTADLSASTKTVTDQNGGVFQPGDLVDYTILVQNNGNAPASGVVVTDVVDANLTDVTPADGGAFDVATRTLLWNVPITLAPGESAEVHFTARVATGLSDGTNIVNQGQITSVESPAPVPTDDPSTPTTDDPTIFSVLSQPDLATSTKVVSLIDDDGLFEPGDEIRYVITATNSGNSAATNLNIQDTLPSELINLVPENGGVVAGNVVTWTLPTLAAGESVELAVIATLSAPLADGLLVSNQALLTSSELTTPVPTDDPATPDLSDPTTFSVTSRPDLSNTTKTFVDNNGGTIEPGDLITWSITVTNEGSDSARGVIVSDVIDLNLTDILPQDGGVFDAATRTLTWAGSPALTALAPGDSTTLSFSSRVREPIANLTQISNQAQVNALNLDEAVLSDDPSTLTPDDVTSFFVVSAADLTGATKRVSPPADGNYRPGELITYTIEFTNTGSDAASGLRVVDVVDPALTDIEVTDGIFDPASRTINWLVGNLPVGESRALSFSARIASPLPNGTLITNQALLQSPLFGSDIPTDDPSTPLVGDPTFVLISSAAGLNASTKSVEDLDGDDIFEPGDEIRYTITARNNGDASSNVTITDVIPTAQLGNLIIEDGGVLAGDTITWVLPNLAPGSSVEVHLRATILEGLSNGALVSNQANLSDDQGRSVLTDDESTLTLDDPTSFTITAAPRLSGITKAVEDLNGGAVLPGDTLRYTIALTNEGSERADGVTVSDPLPPELTSISVSDPRGVFDPASRTITWNLGAMLPGASESLTFDAVVLTTTPDGAILSNQARVTSNDPGLLELSDDPVTPAEDDATIVVINGSPELNVTKSVVKLGGGDELRPGDQVEYTITLRNLGFAPAINAAIADPIPLQLTDIVSDPPGLFSAGAVSWGAPIIPAMASVSRGDELVFTITGRVADNIDSGTVISNQAIAQDDTGVSTVSDDPTTLAPFDATLIEVSYPSFARIDKRVEDLNGGAVEPGDLLRYTIEVEAAEGAPLQDIMVMDPLDAQLALETIGQGGQLLPASNRVQWNAVTTPGLGSIAPGETVTLSFTARVQENVVAGAVISNQAEVNLPPLSRLFLSDDPGLPGDEDPTRVIVNEAATAQLRVLKSAAVLDGGELQPGKVIVYTFTLSNEGSRDLSEVILTDVVPAFTEYVSGSMTLNGDSIPDGPSGESLLVQGLLVNSEDSFGGRILANQSAVVTFQARVTAETLDGQLIVNQGSYAAQDVAAVPVFHLEGISDGDPLTVDVNEPTILQVGGGAVLALSSKSARGLDENSNGQIDVGESVEYTIELRNEGDATAVGLILTDLIPEGLLYQGGTLTVNGLPVTDGDDGDPGAFIDGAVVVALPSLAAGQTVPVTFRVTALREGEIDNQGRIEVPGLPPVLTDDLSTPVLGDPTRITVGDTPLVQAFKQVQDLNGGTFEVGDEVRYSIVLRGSGAEDNLLLTFTDEIPDVLTELTLETAPEGAILVVNGNRFEFSDLALGRDDSLTVTILGRIGEAAEGLDEPICNMIIGVVVGAGSRFQSNEACFELNGTPTGFALLSGDVLWDRDGDKQVSAGDKPLKDWKVKAFALSDPNGEAIVEAAADRDGGYSLLLPAGEYFLRYYSEGNVRFGRYPLSGAILANEGGAISAPILVDPQGIVYDSQTGSPLSGVQLSMRYDEGDIEGGEQVPLEAFEVGSNQQGQRTTRDGFYRFDLPPNRLYRVQVDLNQSQSYQFPSVFLPANSERLLVDRPIDVVPQALPTVDADASKEYFLSFDLRPGAGEGARHNHIPLDPIRSLISLDKRVDRRTASVGDIITYSITVQNRSNRDLVFDPLGNAEDPLNGVLIQDEFPVEGALVYAAGSARAKIVESTQTRSLVVALDKEGTTAGRSILRFGQRVAGDVVGLDLPAGGRLELTYRASVSIKADPGRKYRNVATLYDRANSPLSDPDTAEVRVIYDPILDQGVVIGKVFCDANANGYQDSGEQGVFHSKVVFDTGHYSMTDVHGKFHFHDIDPGSHMVKIDVNSLPPGSTLTTAESRVFYQTRGLPLKVNFGVACATSEIVDQVSVTVGPGLKSKAEAQIKERFVEVAGDLEKWSVEIEGKSFDLMQPTLRVATKGSALVTRTEGAPGGPKDPQDPQNPKDTKLTPVLVMTLSEGNLKEPLLFKLGTLQGPAPARWKLRVVETLSQKEVRVFSGEGSPPSSIIWDGSRAADSTPALTAGGTYQYWLDVIGEGDDFGRSAIGTLQITGTAEETIEEFFVDAYDGPLFEEDGVMTPLLKDALAGASSLFETLPKGASIVVEVHIDDELSAFEAFEVTDLQADALRAEFDARGWLKGIKVKVSGQGSDNPILPNLDEESRLQNQRVVIRQVRESAGKAKGDAKVSQFTQHATINDYAVPFGDDDFDVLLPRPTDGLLIIDLQRADGSRAIKALRIDKGEEKAKKDASIPTIPLKVDPEAGAVSIAGSTHVFALRGVSLKTDREGYELGVEALSPTVQMALSVPAQAKVRAWILEVKSVDSGKVVYRTSKEGAPPAKHRWGGSIFGGESVLSGEFEARLTLLGDGASRAISAPARFQFFGAGETPLPILNTKGKSKLQVNGRKIDSTAGNYTLSIAGVTGEAILVDLTLSDGTRLIEAVTIPEGFEKGMAPAPSEEVTPKTNASSTGDGTAAGPAGELSPIVIPKGGAPAEPAGGVVVPPVDAVSPEAMPQSSKLIRALPAGSIQLPDAEGFRPLRGHRLGVKPTTRAPRFRLLLAQEIEANPEGIVPLTEIVASKEGARGSDSGEAVAKVDRSGEGDPKDAPKETAGSKVAVAKFTPEEFQVLAGFGNQQLDQALKAEGLIDLEAMRRGAQAAQLKVALPPSNMKLNRNDLVVAGTTHPTNKLTVNGRPVTVRANGTFHHVVKLPDGASTLVVESLDPEGNRGRIEWPVEVAPVQYFLMAFAEGITANSAMKYAGANEDNSMRLDGGTLLYGQARLYFKGRLKGSEMGTDFFEAYQATVHLDTSKQAEFEEMFSMVINPDEYYAVYGDSSEQVHEANARGKLYLLVEADETYLKYANFRADMKGLEFFDYAKAFYGLDMAFNKKIGDFDTKARVWVAADSWLGDGSPRLRHAFNYLRGTGGSLYYLQNDQLLEGSEQVFLIVKDRVTGAEISRIPQTRNVDYTIRPREGRILFKSPVQSVADDLMLTGGRSTTRDTRGGNPVFIEVSYQYEVDENGGGTSWGTQLRESMLDNKLSIGLGFVQEGRDGVLAGEDYQLFGLDAAYRHSAQSFAEAEYARSRSYDAFASLSEDGGLSFDGLQRRSGVDDIGNALHLRGQFELADVLEESERPRLLQTGAYYDRSSSGFYANRNALDRGVKRFGGEVIWFADKQNSVTYKHDSVLTEVDDFVDPDPEALKTLARRVNRIRHDYREELWKVGTEYNYTFADDYRAKDGFGLQQIASRFEYSGIKKLRLGVSQEIVVAADDARLVNDTAERFTTGVTVAWDILDDMSIELTEKVRWNGENSTRLGIRTAVGNGATTYIQQRVGNMAGGKRFSTTTVVGGEQRFGDKGSGRAFGEYQLEGGVSAQSNRAIMGLGKRWTLARGFVMDTAYERTQIFGRYGQGDSSRDVVSVGWQLTRYDWIKVGTRFEFRYDDGNKEVTQGSPCARNGISDTPDFCQDLIKGGFDRYQIVALNGVDWKWTEDLTFLVRYNIALTKNITLGTTEQIDQAMSLGFALRPVNYDLINILFKYTYLDQQRPLALEEYNIDRTRKHVLSIVPIIELPFGFQVINKAAWKRVDSQVGSFDETLPNIVTDTILYVTRLNYHLWKLTKQFGFDIGVEYRFLKQMEPELFEHGTLLDFDLVIDDHMRVGFGYNFTSFTDNEFAEENEDNHGWFFRVRGTY